VRDPPTGLRCVQTTGDQKDRARKKAFQDWAQEPETGTRTGPKKKREAWLTAAGRKEKLDEQGCALDYYLI